MSSPSIAAACVGDKPDTRALTHVDCHDGLAPDGESESEISRMQPFVVVVPASAAAVAPGSLIASSVLQSVLPFLSAGQSRARAHTGVSSVVLISSSSTVSKPRDPGESALLMHAICSVPCVNRSLRVKRKTKQQTERKREREDCL